LFVLALLVMRLFIVICPSNQIMVIAGGAGAVVDGRRYGFRLQKSGWTLVIPYIQRVYRVDMTIIPINVRVEEVNSANGIKVGADATACVCVDDQNDTLLYSAVQQLLGKSRVEIRDQIQQTMIGNFRAALNKTTPLQAIGMVESIEIDSEPELADRPLSVVNPKPANLDKAPAGTYEGERALFRSFLLQDCQGDLSPFGIQVVSVSMQRVWDTSNYIANLANKTLSHKRREVQIEEARLHAQAQRAESDAQRRMQVAESQANERIVATRQDLEVFRRQCDAQVRRVQLEADSGITQAANSGRRTIEEQRVVLQQLRNMSEVTLEAEAKRAAAELIAAGQGEAVKILRGAQNDLLAQKVELVKEHGDLGKMVLFFASLPQLFTTYQQHAQTQHVQNLLMLSEEDGFTRAVNRGPAALVDFVRQLEGAFGLDIRQLMGGRPSQS
jgi:flotillin